MLSKNNMNIGGVAYKKAGLYNNSSASLMRLLDLVEGFNRVTDLDKMLAKIGDASQLIMNTQLSVVMLLDENKDELCVNFCTELTKNETKGKCISRCNQGFSGWVAKHKVPLIANDIDNSSVENTIFEDNLKNDFVVRNLICAPLLDKENNLIGVIEAVNRCDSRRLTEEDMPVFQVLANHAATAIERIQIYEKQNKRLNEQDVVLTEIHHRVKNDLALISGIVEVESLDIKNEDAQNVLNSIQSRIKSMAVVYELLSGKGSHTKAEVGTYFKKLVHEISAGFKNRGTNIDIRVHTDPLVLDPYKALSCGLILNELLLNSYKYAFKERSEGHIDIELSRQKENVLINYQDDGPGLPDDFEIGEQDSIGFKMIEALVDQLDGSLEIGKGKGAHFMIRFQVPEKKRKTTLKRVAS